MTDFTKTESGVSFVNRMDFSLNWKTVVQWIQNWIQLIEYAFMLEWEFNITGILKTISVFQLTAVFYQ